MAIHTYIDTQTNTKTDGMATATRTQTYIHIHFRTAAADTTHLKKALGKSRQQRDLFVPNYSIIYTSKYDITSHDIT